MRTGFRDTTHAAYSATFAGFPQTLQGSHHGPLSLEICMSMIFNEFHTISKLAQAVQ